MYLKNYIGNLLFKTAAAKKVAYNSFFQIDTNNIHRVSHNGVNVQKVVCNHTYLIFFYM